MKNYKNKWIIQRVSALILIPLLFWFIFQCLSFSTMEYSQIIIFFTSTLNSFLFLIMMLVTIIHAKLGCDNIIEDYVSGKKIKFISKLTIIFLFYLSALIFILSIMKVSLL